MYSERKWNYLTRIRVNTRKIVFVYTRTCAFEIYAFVLLRVQQCNDKSHIKTRGESSANNIINENVNTRARRLEMYYHCTPARIALLKIQLVLSIDNVCLRPWSFERIPNKMIRGLDNALIYTSTKEACLAACLNEVSTARSGRNNKILFVITYLAIIIRYILQHRFTCRSVEYNYVTLQCHLSDSDRRTTGQYVQFVEAQGVDYFENLCIKGNNHHARLGLVYCSCTHVLTRNVANIKPYNNI